MRQQALFIRAVKESYDATLFILKFKACNISK